MMLNRQTTAVVGLLAVVCSGAVKAPEKPQAVALRHECDTLLSDAVRRPYGWGWTEVVERIDPKVKHRTAPPRVELGLHGSAAVGFVLFWAGELLDEPAYRQAAVQVARGLLASQKSTGQIPPAALFLPNSAGAKEEPALLADRASTRAALGLLLTLVDEHAVDESLKRSAIRAASWLISQQPTSGGWPVAYPPATQPKDAMRLIRLDTPDFRDSTLALLLAYEVLEDPLYRGSVDRTADLLLRMRLGGASRAGARLWTTAYHADGIPTDILQNELLPGIDVLACRYALQTLFAQYIVLGSSASVKAIDQATGPLQTLPHSEAGEWNRIYDQYGAAVSLNGAAAAPAGDLFHPPNLNVPPSMQRSTFGLDTLLPSIAQAKTEGRTEYERRLAGLWTRKQHLALTLCGLSDDPLVGNWPATPYEAKQFLQSHEAKWKQLEGAAPIELSNRVQRLLWLLVRAKLEQKFDQ